jgi:hypothetical protein
MYNKFRFFTALLIISALTCGSLSAFPLGHRTVLANEGAGTLTAVMEWVASLFIGDKPHGKLPKHPLAKGTAQIDPDGQH